MYIRTLPIKNDLHAVCELKLNIRAFFIHPFTGFTAPLSYDHPEKKSKIKFLQLFFFFWISIHRPQLPASGHVRIPLK